MKKLLFLIVLSFIIIECIVAQETTGFKYQAVVRDNSGELLVEQGVDLKLSIEDISAGGTVLYIENHSKITNAYGVVDLVIGEGAVELGTFSEINWGENKKFLKLEIDAGSGLKDVGTVQLLSVPYALFANSAANLGGDKVYSTSSDTLFVVKDNVGNVVFAVFPDGAQIFVDESTKGKVGGFAVSGRNPNKAESVDIFKVTPDSTRVFVNSTTAKGKVGGFAVSGRNPNKAIGDEYLVITPDSTRIFINESSKGKVGGFAVSGRNPNKGEALDYFNVSSVSSAGLDKIDPSQPRMLWYPKSEAFLVGRVLVEHPDSVGLNSIATGFESKAIGNYSQSFGYQAIARKDYSTAIGKNAVAAGASSYAIGDMASTSGTTANSYAIGRNALAKGESSYAIGNGAIAAGDGSFAFGAGGRDSLGVALPTTTEAVGLNSFAMGLGSKSLGLNSFSIGTGTVTTVSGENAVAMGFGSTASGRYAVALGYKNVSSGASAMTWGGVRSGTSDYVNVASGRASTAWGFRTEASGLQSTTWGADTDASGWNSTAWGGYSKAEGYCATAWGRSSIATKDYCTTWGSYSKAIGYRTTAAGESLVANALNSFVIGRANDTIYNHTDINYYDGVSPWSYIEWYNDDPLFVVGNGQYHPAVGTKNALTVLKGGTTIVGWNTSVNNDADPRARFDLSVQAPYDAGYMFYVHGKAGGTGAWASTSDERLKKNINTIDGALDKVLKLRGVNFEWKDSERKGRQIGFIAQETKEVIPEVIIGTEETKYSMQYAPVTAVLVEAVKEQQQQIDNQKSKIDLLEKENKELVERLKKLEELILK